MVLLQIRGMPKKYASEQLATQAANFCQQLKQATVLF